MKSTFRRGHIVGIGSVPQRMETSENVAWVLAVYTKIIIKEMTRFIIISTNTRYGRKVRRHFSYQKK